MMVHELIHNKCLHNSTKNGKFNISNCKNNSNTTQELLQQDEQALQRINAGNDIFVLHQGMEEQARECHQLLREQQSTTSAVADWNCSARSNHMPIQQRRSQQCADSDNSRSKKPLLRQDKCQYRPKSKRLVILQNPPKLTTSMTKAIIIICSHLCVFSTPQTTLIQRGFIILQLT